MLDRRSLMIAAAAAAVAGKVRAAPANPVIPLWPHEPPGGGGPLGAIEIGPGGAASNIAMPSLEVFAPARPNGASMLVAGGGGYRRIGMGSEAYPAARWLAARGFTAFVLAYRLPPEGWRDGPLAPLQDAQRALRLIRAGAVRRRLDPARIGVLGFSAGGHLLGLAAARSAFHSYQPLDASDDQSARPDCAALIYPVITLEPPYDHTSTRRSLVGDHPDSRASAAWSVETYVRRDCPPIFLAQAVDDPVSSPENSAIMADVCRRAGVPIELHRLASGGHGFGMGRPGTPTDWPNWYEPWLRRAGMIA